MSVRAWLISSARSLSFRVVSLRLQIRLSRAGRVSG